jgi:hypothetical protein
MKLLIMQFSRVSCCFLRADPDIVLNTLLLHILNLCSSLRVGD